MEAPVDCWNTVQNAGIAEDMEDAEDVETAEDVEDAEDAEH